MVGCIEKQIITRQLDIRTTAQGGLYAKAYELGRSGPGKAGI